LKISNLVKVKRTCAYAWQISSFEKEKSRKHRGQNLNHVANI
jgi:hypothetical protein